MPFSCLEEAVQLSLYLLRDSSSLIIIVVIAPFSNIQALNMIIFVRVSGRKKKKMSCQIQD